MKHKFEESKRRSIFSEVGDYCFLSGENDFIEVTEWSNGEGFDVTLSAKQIDTTIPFTWGQFKLLKKLVKQLNKVEN